LALGDAELLVLTDGEGLGQGVADALATAVPDGEAEMEGDALGVGVADGLALADADPDGVAVAATQLAVGDGARRVRLAGEPVLLPPSSKSAAGTTSNPRMTVITKASAPHSWSQKARDELRIRARRPARAEVCCAY
jgi:hypothetical protein